MIDNPLALIPMQDLIDEIKNRSKNCVVIYNREVDNNAPVICWDWSAEDNIYVLGMLDRAKVKVNELIDEGTTFDGAQ